MLSRLKRKPPSTGSSAPDSPSSVQLEHDDDHAPPPPPPSASSPPSSRSSYQQRSFTTPVKGRTQGHLSTDSLSPTRHRAYTSTASPDDHGLVLRRPTSRASSFGSAHLDRPAFDSPASTSTHAIGEGSLSLHHLAPPPSSHPSSSSSSNPALTLVVQAPELAAHSAAASRDVYDHHDYHLHPDADDHLETPTSYSDHRTPLASHEPLFDPHAPTTLGSSTQSQPVPVASSSLSPAHAAPHARPRSHTSSEAVLRSAPLAAAAQQHPRALRASDGLDALEAINRGPSSRSGARSGSGSGTGPGTGTGSGTASPPSMSRASSRGAGPGAAAFGSRPVSRSNSITSQQQQPHAHQGEPHLAATARALRPGSAASGARSYSPARGRKPGSGSSNGGGGPSAKGGIAGALALSGVSLATPGGARPPGVALGAGLMAAAAAAAAGAGEGERERAPASPGAGGAAAGSPTHVAPPQASARTSLESHIAAAAGSPYHASGAAGDESDGVGSSSIYLGHHGSGDHASAFLSMDHLGDYDDVVSQLGTGYAVASSKRNADFHALFKNVPDDDYLIEDYGCALQREILIQGRLYISEHHLSFYANIFGWVTSLVIPFSEVCSIEKRMTAYVIPNAIQVATMHARHTFASFLSRDTTYDLIGNIWRMIHPVIPLSAALPDALSTSTSRTGHEHESDDEPSPVGGGGSAATAVSASGVEVTQSSEGVGSRAKRRLKGLRKRGGTGESAQGGKAVVDGGVRSSPGGGGAGAASRAAGGAQDRVDGDEDDEGGSAGGKKKKKGGGAATPPHAPTTDTCPTLKNLKEVCMDAQFPGAPEKIYNLMFTSGFMKGFWAENQKLMEIQIGDWAPQASGSNLLARSMSYIKPLNGSIGPRQTKCLITDESAHVDFDDFVCVVTTTRTPDVPSGSAFSVKTRTSMTWARGNHCRVVVTTGVEWTKSSFIKGIIEKSAIDGQKQYHTDLEKAMRAYIATHRNEFVEEGHDPDDDESDLDSVDGLAATAAATAEDGVDASVAAELASARERTGLLAPLWSALEPLFEHLAHQSPQSLLLGAVVAILVLSNLWTLRTASHDVHPAERARRRVAAGESSSGSGSAALGPLPPAVAPVGVVPPQQDPQDVANAVRDVLHHYFAAQQQQQQHTAPAPAAQAPTAAPVEVGGGGPGTEHGHVGALARELDALEARVRALKEQLGALPSGPPE
ncbi:hypothetical protein JCM8208_001633 [Rhodotorula glutinis]